MAARSFEGAKLGVGAVLLIVLGFWFAYRFVSPAPPDKIRFASGQPGGAYAIFADRYRAELAQHGIDVEVVPSAGTLDNLVLLASGEVDAALVQSGVAGPGVEGLLSLGSVFHEPLWIFLARDTPIELLTDMRGRRIEVGREGSGTRALATRLLDANGVFADDAERLGSDVAQAAQSIESGQADALFVVASVESPVVRGLIERPTARLLDVKRAAAYTRLDRSLSKLVLPRGVIDLETDLPSSDRALVSTAAEIVVGPDFHPALVDLLLQAAEGIHGVGDVLTEPGAFPSPRFVDLPLSPEADRYFEYGPPFLQRYLPFWAATQVDRLKVMLIPLIALLLPLIRIFPPTYRWRVRSRIYRWYRELRKADPEAVASLDEATLRERLAEVDRIEAEVSKVPTPTSYAEELYSLRLHIEFVRRGLAAAIEATTGEAVEERGTAAVGAEDHAQGGSS